MTSEALNPQRNLKRKPETASSILCDCDKVATVPEDQNGVQVF